ncbi:hypothetical protein FDB39_05725 [Clostridium botulinum]|nr:hypothetical protein [Clostridium botulinum]
MDIQLDLNQTYTTGEGEEVICYEKTERFAFLCPYKLKDDKTAELNISKTKVYSMEIDDTSVEAIEIMEVSK